jgi:hypothetical protein
MHDRPLLSMVESLNICIPLHLLLQNCQTLIFCYLQQFRARQCNYTTECWQMLISCYLQQCRTRQSNYIPVIKGRAVSISFTRK